MKNKTVWSVAIIIILIGGIVWWSNSIKFNQIDQTENQEDIISKNGIHWHPELTIIVKGEKQIIPANIGIGQQYSSYQTFDTGMRMTAIHTHDDADQGIIHFEFSGIVRKSDLTLGKFLDIWGRDINSFGSNPQMTVNGIENTELQSYSMKDKDKITIEYK